MTNYEEYSGIVRITSNEGTGCKNCNVSTGMRSFKESLNHYIKKHGYKLLYVVTEKIPSEEGQYSTLSQF